MPSESVLVLSSRFVLVGSGQKDSFLRRRTALALEVTSPWSRQTQSFFRQSTALYDEPLEVTVDALEYDIDDESLEETEFKFESDEALASMCNTATKSGPSGLWRKR